jgi:hypothetical protein
MIGWLTAMKTNDPVAARAGRVVRETLKKFTPAMQAQASDLLSLDEFSNMSPLQEHKERPPSMDYQRTAHQSQADTRRTEDSSEVAHSQIFLQQGQYAVQEQASDTYPFSLLDYGTLPMPFGNPFFSDFDQNMPYTNPQDLWGGAEPFHTFDPNWPLLANPQDDIGEPDDKDMDETPQ